MAPHRKSLSLRKRMETILQTPLCGEKYAGLLEELGLPAARADYLDVVLAGLLKAAAAGNVPAFKELRDLLGDEDTGQMFQRLDSILAALNGREDSFHA